MSGPRRWALVALPWIPLAFALYFLVSDHGTRRMLFALYRPATAQFFLDRGVAAGSDLTYDRRVMAVMPLGASGDIGLVCPKSAGETGNAFRAFNGKDWVVWVNPPGVAERVLALGQAGDLPFCADFAGDGVVGSGVFRNGEWLVSSSNRGVGGDLRFSFGAPGDRPVIANIAGRGNRTDRRNIVYGVYRKGIWYLDTDGSGTVAATHAFGGDPQDLPLLIPRWSTDKSVDGKYSLVVFRAGIWFLKPDPEEPQVISFAFGQAGDVPSIQY